MFQCEMLHGVTRSNNNFAAFLHQLDGYRSAGSPREVSSYTKLCFAGSGRGPAEAKCGGLSRPDVGPRLGNGRDREEVF